MNKQNLLEQKINAVKKAIEIVGTQEGLAALCNLKQQNVLYWLKKGVPVKHVLTLERALNFKVTRHELAPDFYPNEKLPNS